MAQIFEDTLVKLDVPLGEEVIRLSALDQQAQRSYRKFLTVFELDKGAKTVDIVKHLKHGLAVALTETPDLACTIAPLPGSTRKELELRLGPDSGVQFRVVGHGISQRPHEQQSSSPLSARTYADLASARFPIAQIATEVLFPPEASCEDVYPEGITATRVQANFIDGGLIMALSWHHTVCDARAIANFSGSWARHTKTSTVQGATHAVPAAPAEHAQERWRLESGSPDADVRQLTAYTINPALRSPLTPASAHLLDRPESPDAADTFSTWYFSPAALKSLRSLLAESGVEDGSSFTQSEAVSALIWKHLSVARSLSRDAPMDATSLFSTRIDFRARAKPAFHEDFVGNINEPNARARVDLQEVCAPSTPQSLATLSQAIRKAVVSVGEDDLRRFIGVVNDLPAVTDLSSDYNTYPGPDLAVTDMSGLATLRQDWGGQLGYPTCVRSASYEKGVAYVFPQDRDGGFEVQLQSETEAVEKLKKDAMFTRFAQFRCAAAQAGGGGAV